jgi:hypothetical protein
MSVTYGAGATRSEKALRYSLIPPEALKRIAARFTLGETQYGANNWKKGMPIDVTIDHLEEHLRKFKLGSDHSDDHLGAMGWAICALMWYAEYQPLMIHDYTMSLLPAPSASPVETCNMSMQPDKEALAKEDIARLLHDNRQLTKDIVSLSFALKKARRSRRRK